MGKVKTTYIILNTFEYSKWETEIRAEFEADKDVIILNQIIEETKKHLLKPTEDEDSLDAKPYRNLKIRRQMLWLNFYENELVKKLEEAFLDVTKHHVADLYIVVMPEVLIRDDNYEDKHPYSHYVNPLYEDVVKAFLGSDDTLKKDGSVERLTTNEESRTLIDFTQANPNVIIFAGTIWWKRWHRDYPKGILFNSAPVFYNGKCGFLWDKQYLSAADGVPGDKLLEQWIKYRIDFMPMLQPSAAAQPYPADIREMENWIQNYYDSDQWCGIGLISNLTKKFNPYANPLMAVTLPNQEELVFGIDICMDDYYREDKSLSQHFMEYNVPIRIINAQRYGEPLMSQQIEKPDIQIIVANSFGRHRNYFSRSIVCLCDLELSSNSTVLTLNPFNQSFNSGSLTNYQNHFFMISDPIEVTTGLRKEQE